MHVNITLCLFYKHGRVVGGVDTLDAMEKVETDKKDKPKVQNILWAIVHNDT